jgi:uncharacterized membrane protein YhhN
MTKTKPGKALAIILPFATLEAALWIALISGRAASDKYFLFSAVALAFILSAVLFADKARKNISSPSFKPTLSYAVGCGRAMQFAALLFTLIADYFLVLKDAERKTLAMIFFLIAQMAYAMKTLRFDTSKKEKMLHAVLRLSLSIIGAAATLLVLGEACEMLFVISVIYYVNLLISMVISFLHSRSKEALVTGIGLLCFALCDVSIGFDFLVDIFSLTEGNFIFDFIAKAPSFVHIFYPPSQTILAISAFFSSDFDRECKCKLS